MRSIYIIRKYIVATSAKDAIRKDRTTAVNDCYMEENSQKKMVDSLIDKPKSNVGFKNKKCPK